MRPVSSPRSNAPTYWTSLLAIGGMLLLGVAGGFAWHAWWTPTGGVVVDDTWIVLPDDAGREFAATGGFVLGSLLLGVVSGLLIAWRVRPYLVGVLVAAVGGLLAGLVMAFVGHQLGPEDPRPQAAGQADLTAIPADLRVSGGSPYLGFPGGALLAVGLSFLLVSERSQTSVPDSSSPGAGYAHSPLD
jgi:hypothetical protein